MWRKRRGVEMSAKSKFKPRRVCQFCEKPLAARSLGALNDRIRRHLLTCKEHGKAVGLFEALSREAAHPASGAWYSGIERTPMPQGLVVVVPK